MSYVENPIENIPKKKVYCTGSLKDGIFFHFALMIVWISDVASWLEHRHWDQ